MGKEANITLPISIRGKTFEKVKLNIGYTPELKEIELPDKLEVIGENAFSNSGIERVEIPGTVRLPVWQRL